MRDLWPRWLFVGSRIQVVSFVPRPGVELAPLPSAAWPGPWARLGQRQRQQRYGSQLVLMPKAMDASVDDLASAVRRLSVVPVRR